jgi:probable phosphoglycerate mutase
MLQAAALARSLRRASIDAVYCSDLARARQTAAVIAAQTRAPLTELANLREISLGAWEGLPRRAVATRRAGEFAARGRDIENYRIPGGESFADCRQRALAAWGAILRSGAGRIAVVGHAGVNRVLLCRLLGMPAAHLFRLGQDYGCVNVIEVDGDRVVIRLVNGRAADIGNAAAN